MAVKGNERFKMLRGAPADAYSDRYELPAEVSTRDPVLVRLDHDEARSIARVELIAALGRELTDEDADRLKGWWDYLKQELELTLLEDPDPPKPPGQISPELADHLVAKLQATEEAVYALPRLLGELRPEAQQQASSAAVHLQYLIKLVRWCRKRGRGKPRKRLLDFALRSVPDLMDMFGLQDSLHARRIFILCSMAAIGVPPNEPDAVDDMDESIRKALEKQKRDNKSKLPQPAEGAAKSSPTSPSSPDEGGADVAVEAPTPARGRRRRPVRAYTFRSSWRYSTVTIGWSRCCCGLGPGSGWSTATTRHSTGRYTHRDAILPSSALVVRPLTSSGVREVSACCALSSCC